jgi:hypothetical protein
MLKEAGIVPPGSILKIKRLKDALATGKIKQVLNELRKNPLVGKNHLETAEQLLKEYSVITRKDLHPLAKDVVSPLRRIYETVRNNELNITQSLTPISSKLGTKLQPVVNQAKTLGLQATPPMFRPFDKLTKSTGTFIPALSGNIIELPWGKSLPHLRTTLAHELGHVIDAQTGKYGLTNGTLGQLAKTVEPRNLLTGKGMANYLKAELSANQRSQQIMQQLVNHGQIPLGQLAEQTKHTRETIAGSNRSHFRDVLTHLAKLGNEEKLAFQKRMRKAPLWRGLSPETVDPAWLGKKITKFVPAMQNLVNHRNFDLSNFDVLD